MAELYTGQPYTSNMSSPDFTLPDGTVIPQLGLGLWRVEAGETQNLVHAALDVGYRHFDTATLYQNERELGAALRESGIDRADVYITTKVWNDRHGDAPAALGESLERLGTDYVDLYLIHWPCPANDRYIETWQQLLTLRDQGLARSIGVSNFLPEHLTRLVTETGCTPTVNQVELHPTFSQPDLVAVHDELKIATQAWRPLGKGEDLSAGPIVEIAERLGRTPAQIVIRWHLQQQRILFPKTAQTSRLAENFDVFDFELNAADLAAIDTVNIGQRLGAHPNDMN